jgi:hypothetical protein
MAYVLDKEYYLMGVYFDSDIINNVKEYDKWHDEIKSPLNNKNHNTTSNKKDVTEMVILKHISRVLRLAEENYELTFPRRFKGIDFKPAKILPEQLAYINYAA